MYLMYTESVLLIVSWYSALEVEHPSRLHCIKVHYSFVENWEGCAIVQVCISNFVHFALSAVQFIAATLFEYLQKDALLHKFTLFIKM